MFGGMTDEGRDVVGGQWREMWMVWKMLEDLYGDIEAFDRD